MRMIHLIQVLQISSYDGESFFCVPHLAHFQFVNVR